MGKLGVVSPGRKPKALVPEAVCCDRAEAGDLNCGYFSTALYQKSGVVCLLGHCTSDDSDVQPPSFFLLRLVATSLPSVSIFT